MPAPKKSDRTFSHTAKSHLPFLPLAAEKPIARFLLRIRSHRRSHPSQALKVHIPAKQAAAQHTPHRTFRQKTCAIRTNISKK